MVLPAAARCKGTMLGRLVWILLLFGLLLLSGFCEACKKITFNVPHKLDAGMFIGRVNMKLCFQHFGIISSNNPNFTVLNDSLLYTTTAMSLSSHENTIALSFKGIDENEPRMIYVNLQTYSGKTARDNARRVREAVVSRTKRRWAPVPTIIMENSLGPFPMQIQQLSSDMAQKYNIKYSITGPGVDQVPLHYFYIEEDTGNLFVTCPIDREEYPEFQLICYAVTSDGYTPEVPLVHIIRIEDDNDNAPEFDHDIYTFHVLENSRIGTLVGQVTATDKDEPDTLHTKLKYRILSQHLLSPQTSALFAIHPDTGCITVASPHLDRETTSEYLLQVEVRDMGGQDFGLCNTAKVLIVIGDVNDNPPQLLHTMYEVSLLENTVNAELLCIPVSDSDEPGTPSWLASFTIIKGNEDNSFAINVDQERNVGCLVVLKGLDYEKAKERRLEIVVNNEAPYAPPPNARAISKSMVTVVVNIKDQDEGPVFEPCEYNLYIKEGLPTGTVVGNYKAKDPETGSSEGLSYRLISDPCNWIIIDRRGDLTITKVLDRDVPDNKQNHCNVTVSATDQSGKSGIGEIVMTLIDENDNYPVVTKKNYTMCKNKKPVCVTAIDKDIPPNTTPFHFEIETPTDSTWKITPHEDASALILPVADIDYGHYPILLRVYDNGGSSGTSEIMIHYCDCVIPSECVSQLSPVVPLNAAVDSTYAEYSTSFVPWGAVSTVFGSALLMLGMGAPVGYWYRKRGSTHHVVADDVAAPNLITSNTEAPGDILTDVNIFPVKTVSGSMSTILERNVKGENVAMVKGERGSTAELVKGGKSHMSGSLRHIALPLRNSYKDICAEWQDFTNPHLSEMVYLCGQDEEGKHVEEYLLPYTYEGKESPVGTLSSCTGESEEEELDFLNEPEPPFRTLAETFANSLGSTPDQTLLK
ncbi:desmocollin-1 [Anolis carolinensis]|uniref:Cadherin domain-containing protein n=1 Tax=Anolis carolinensis TaxID=28377 RepID=H9GPS5_ANOCA|nr:PREDICTED: desmocollin-1 isoform X1 [Anolis carolinensis]|eukprot:XP_016850633.1 PREDICTED: desmocollin-1 isoform X1 [Anolis carolinensis]